MTIAIALLAGSAIVAFVAPRFLHRLGSAGFDPVVVTVGWLVAIAGVLGTAAAALIVMTVPHQTYGHRLGSLIDSAWWALTRDAPELLAYQGSRILAGVALVAGILWVAVVAVRERRRRSQQVGQQLAVLNVVGSRSASLEPGPLTLWLQSDRPLAFSIAGRPGVVVLTDGLRRRLAPDGVEAVLAHERAHLRGRHHLLVATVETLRTALGFVPLFQLAPAAVREQLELAADLSALVRCGVAAVRTALMTVTAAGTPELALAMARDALDVRLRHLANAADPPNRVRRVTTSGVLGAALAATPFVLASGVLVGISAVVTTVGAFG
jgi:Zn-dependent protease with chaperone function